MGPNHMSETENQLVIGLQEEFEFTAAVSFHSYSELVLWPWGYTNKIQSKDHAIFARYGNVLGEILGYKPMQISGLYEAAGAYDDTLYANYGVLSYTIELGKWFIPGEEEVPEINRKNVEALKYLFTEARDPFGERVVDEIFKAKVQLEKLVYLLSTKTEVSKLQLSYDQLRKFDRSELTEAMEGLAMQQALRKKILAELDQSSDYNELHR